MGDVKTLDEEETMSRRDRQRARLQARVAEWWRAGGGNGDDQVPQLHPANTCPGPHSPTVAPRERAGTAMPMHRCWFSARAQ